MFDILHLIKARSLILMERRGRRQLPSGTKHPFLTLMDFSLVPARHLRPVILRGGGDVPFLHQVNSVRQRWISGQSAGEEKWSEVCKTNAVDHAYIVSLSNIWRLYVTRVHADVLHMYTYICTGNMSVVVKHGH